MSKSLNNSLLLAPTTHFTLCLRIQQIKVFIQKLQILDDSLSNSAVSKVIAFYRNILY